MCTYLFTSILPSEIFFSFLNSFSIDPSAAFFFFSSFFLFFFLLASLDSVQCLCVDLTHTTETSTALLLSPQGTDKSWLSTPQVQTGGGGGFHHCRYNSVRGRGRLFRDCLGCTILHGKVSAGKSRQTNKLAFKKL